MTQSVKPLVKMFSAGRENNPARFSSGEYANLYYLGEEGLELLKGLKLGVYVERNTFFMRIQALESRINFILSSLEDQLGHETQRRMLEKIPYDKNVRQWLILRDSLAPYNIAEAAMNKLVEEGKVNRGRAGWIKRVKETE